LNIIYHGQLAVNGHKADNRPNLTVSAAHIRCYHGCAIVVERSVWMKSFYRFVTGKPRLVIAIFLLLATVSVFCWTGVSVNYNVTDYLPDDTPSTVALDVLGDEFSGGIPNARVMVRGVTLSEALELKEQIAAIQGVESVTWLDDALNVLE